MIAGNSPTGQGTGRLLDIALRKVADSKSEQLHQLAAEVFVGMALAVGLGVQPDEQSRIMDDAPQQFAKRYPRVFALDFILAADGETHLGSAGGKMVMPQERQPFAERVWAEEHAVHPPGLETDDITVLGRSVEQHGGGGREVLRHAQPARIAGEQAIDTDLGAIFQIALQLAPGSSETGAAMQVHYAAEIPRDRGAGDIRIPGVIGSGRLHASAVSNSELASGVALAPRVLPALTQPGSPGRHSLNVSDISGYPASMVSRSVGHQSGGKRENLQLPVAHQKRLAFSQRRDALSR